jgi:hypothetical protein
MGKAGKILSQRLIYLFKMERKGLQRGDGRIYQVPWFELSLLDGRQAA